MEFTNTAEPIARLIEEFNKLPGIGPKSAQRLTYYLLQSPPERVEMLAEAIKGIKQSLRLCSVCLNITDSETCIICRDNNRDRSRICVVEEPADILPLERTRKYRGLYHVLHGVISPGDGVGPDDIKLNELMRRIQNGGVTEVILATNPNLEGDATAMYIQRLIASSQIQITRLARGLPFGGDLEYADDVTLSRALEGRQSF
ncbi:MAG TPA: recombination protein RecR [Dehalococcoidia bacterium]|nr:recombination protein RecR [Dehalococcoidia bacterium]